MADASPAPTNLFVTKETLSSTSDNVVDSCDITLNGKMAEEMSTARAEFSGEGGDAPAEEKKRPTCQACKHCFDQTGKIIATPAASCNTPCVSCEPRENEHILNSKQVKSWKSRRYADLCTCAELGLECHCNSAGNNSFINYLQMSVPSWWGPRIKRTLVIVAAAIPIILVIGYLVLYYKYKT